MENIEFIDLLFGTILFLGGIIWRRLEARLKEHEVKFEDFYKWRGEMSENNVSVVKDIKHIREIIERQSKAVDKLVATDSELLSKDNERYLELKVEMGKMNELLKQKNH